MPKTCDVPTAGAKVVMLTRDEHCPAHVHAMNSSRKWEIKVFFAYADNDPDHWTFEIIKGTPLAGQINDVIDAVEVNLNLCRELWWKINSDVCLINKFVAISPFGILTKTSNGTGIKVAAANYLPAGTQVSFRGVASQNWLKGACP